MTNSNIYSDFRNVNRLLGHSVQSAKDNIAGVESPQELV